MSRGQFNNPQDYFNRNFEEMEHPFGHPSKEYWIGLNHMYHLTNNGVNYVLKFELLGADGVYKEALYGSFRILNDEFYTLHNSGYMAAESTVANSWAHHNNRKFSAKDVDNDDNGAHCAALYLGPNW